jgi:hypothetical protein
MGMKSNIIFLTISISIFTLSLNLLLKLEYPILLSKNNKNTFHKIKKMVSRFLLKMYFCHLDREGILQSQC